jgi:hypothetical protein
MKELPFSLQKDHNSSFGPQITRLKILNVRNECDRSLTHVEKLAKTVECGYSTIAIGPPAHGVKHSRISNLNLGM